MNPTQLQVPQPQWLLGATYSFSRCLTICSGMRRFWQVVSASHTTASQMLPSWNRRSSDFSPQKVRKSRACGATLAKPGQGHGSPLGLAEQLP